MYSERREIATVIGAMVVFAFLMGGVLFGQERGGQRERPQNAPAAQAAPRPVPPAPAAGPQTQMRGMGQGQGRGQGRGMHMQQGQRPQGPPPGRGPAYGRPPQGRPPVGHAVPRPPVGHRPGYAYRPPYSYWAPAYYTPRVYFGLGYFSSWNAFPYEGYAYSYPQTGIKFSNCPRSADVWVDGGFAGIVDQYDGTFDRLNLPPGNHSVVVKSAEEERGFDIYVQTGQTLKLLCTPVK